jgi:hypothetical protein
MADVAWIAHYNDGSQYPQGTFSKIDRSRLVAFDLLKDKSLFLRVDLRPADVDKDIGPKRLIYRKRVRKDNATGETVLTWYLVGWQRKVKGRNVQSINYVFDDGVIMHGGQFTKGDFQDPIDPLPWELDLKD